MPKLTETRPELEKELRTCEGELRANKRGLIWGAIASLTLAWLLWPPVSLRSGSAIALCMAFLAFNAWGILAGRRRIDELTRDRGDVDRSGSQP